jgi:hypothetical protein
MITRNELLNQIQDDEDSLINDPLTNWAFNVKMSNMHKLTRNFLKGNFNGTEPTVEIQENRWSRPPRECVCVKSGQEFKTITEAADYAKIDRNTLCEILKYGKHNPTTIIYKT